MNNSELIVNEFKRRVFEESYQRIFKCLSLIKEEDLWDSPNGNIPSIGSLILHLCGNARQWVLSGIGNKEDNRDRDNEFLIHKNIRKSDLVFILGNLKVNVREVLDNLEEKELQHKVFIQGFQETKFSVLIHVIEHFSYHTGQITTLTKIATNKDTGYYEGLDLNKRAYLN